MFRCAGAGAALAAATVLPVAGASIHRAAASARITERDFHISAPKQLHAGELRLLVHNKGPDAHELIVVRAGRGRLPLRSDGLTVNEEALGRRDVATLEPGTAGSARELRVHLAPGRYVLLCNMAGHYLGGMHTELIVH